MDFITSGKRNPSKNSDEEWERMITIEHVNPTSAYLEGMIWAVFGVRIFSDNTTEWQIDAVKKYAKKMKGI